MREYVNVENEEKQKELSKETLDSIGIILLNYSHLMKETSCNSISQALQSQAPIKEKEELENE